jgi:hypothetical protein
MEAELNAKDLSNYIEKSIFKATTDLEYLQLNYKNVYIFYLDIGDNI